VLIKACLNGGCSAELPALPLFPGELARDARSVVAGAGALHLREWTKAAWGPQEARHTESCLSHLLPKRY
jgi:uncharacterized protein (DUF849 family)